MPTYYLHAEAFNLDTTVYDTYDISTVRGGSFLLLNAIRELPKLMKDPIKPITTAASKGVFTYEDPGNLASQHKRIDEALSVLHRITGGHAIFGVAVAESEPDFLHVLARLEADVRRQQWRHPTVIVPSPVQTDQECYLDGWRPGTEPYTVDPDVGGAKISAATAYRRRRGRELKHSLFRELFEEGGDDDISARDLGQLATDPSKGILNGKIALLHVDGNSFGSIRAAKCTSPETREQFDQVIQGRRLDFLADLRELAHKDVDFRVRTRSGKDILRLEILLWGGDEFTLIVPAWKGLTVMERFFDTTKDLAFDDIPLTHRAALIFCHHNAPLLQIRQLADDLLAETRNNIVARFKAALVTDPAFGNLDAEDRIIQLARLSNPTYGNGARYLVLESFDMLRGSLKHFLSDFYCMDDAAALLLYGQRLTQLRQQLQAVCTSVSKGRILNIARALNTGNVERQNELLRRLPGSLAPDERDAVMEAITALTEQNQAGWYWLADLWDYVKEWQA